MSPETDAVKKSKSSLSFLAASVVFLVMGAALAALYFYEGSKLSLLQDRLAVSEKLLNESKALSASLSDENLSLQNKLKEDESRKQKIDELLGKTKVLQYEKETLESDAAAKEKKIAELQDQIQKQDEKEEKLMALIEEAKKQMALSRPSAPTAESSTAIPHTAVSADHA